MVKAKKTNQPILPMLKEMAYSCNPAETINIKEFATSLDNPLY